VNFVLELGVRFEWEGKEGGYKEFQVRTGHESTGLEIFIIELGTTGAILGWCRRKELNIGICRR